jgi:hypothetical protein
MKTDIAFRSIRAQFFLEWEMFRTKGTGTVKTHILFVIYFFWISCRLRGDVEKMLYRKRGHTWQCDMALRRCDLHVAITKARYRQQTDTLCNNYCFVTAGMVTQTRLGVPLYVLCHIDKCIYIKNRLYTVWRTHLQGCSVVQHRVASDFCPKLYSYRSGVCHGWRRSVRQTVPLWNGSSSVLFYKEENRDMLYRHMWNTFSAC